MICELCFSSLECLFTPCGRAILKICWRMGSTIARGMMQNHVEWSAPDVWRVCSECGLTLAGVERPLSPDSQGYNPVSEMASKLLKLTRVTLKSGRSPIKYRDHLQTKLKAWHYPLVFYIAMELFGEQNNLVQDFVCLCHNCSEFTCVLSGYLTHIGLLLMGFAKHKLKGTAYFVYEPLRPREKSLAPILFFHGIGLGITPYFRFIYSLMMLGHPVVLVEHRHVSMRLCFSCPTVDDCVEAVAAMLDTQGYKKCIVVSHSYGTFVSSRFLRLHPERIQAMCLIDPVCCSMHNPKLLKNFVYRGVDYKNVVNAMVTGATLAIARDPGISSAVSRGFRWPDLNLWPDLVGKNSMFVLSGKDNMVPIDDIQVQYKSSGVSIICHPEHIHGSFIGDKAWQQTIIEQFKKLPGLVGDSQSVRVIS